MMRSTLPVVILVVLVAFAGCLGGSPDAPGDGGSGGDGDDGDGAGGNGGGGGDGGDGGGDGDDGNGGAGGNGNGGDGGDDDGPTGPRTPTDAMDQTPAETGEGWARFDLNGTADFAVAVTVISAEQNTYSVPLQLRDDIVRVEVALTWEGGFTDLNLGLLGPRNNSHATSAHGAENIPGVLLITPPNGTTWEYIDVGADTLEEVGPGEWSISVQEFNNLTPEGVQATAGVGEGTPFALSVWVYTVDTGMSNHPAGG